jgi:hypothetical protein
VGVGAQESDDTRTTQAQTDGEEGQETNEPGAEQEPEGDVTEQTAAPPSPSGDLALQLQDAGQGAQPFRLLKCGHVFHVSPSLLALVRC